MTMGRPEYRLWIFCNVFNEKRKGIIYYLYFHVRNFHVAVLYETDILINDKHNVFNVLKKAALFTTS